MAVYNYNSLKNTYDEFGYPMVSLKVNEMEFGENKHGFILGDVVIELTSGYEASCLSYHIYQCIDPDTREFLFEKLKKYIFLGSVVHVSMGYSGTLKEVFKGFISQVSFSCEEDGIPCVEVTALDVKGIMMAGSYAKQLKAYSFGAAVKELFQTQVYQNMESSQIITSYKIADTPDRQPEEKKEEKDRQTIEMVCESDYEFIVKAARKFNYEFFIDCGTVIFRKAKNCTGCMIELGMGKGMLNYNISYDITGLVQTIEARGMDASKGSTISAAKKYNHKISAGNKAKQLLAGTKKIYIDATITSKELAAARLESLAEDMSYRFGNLECECIGLPELKPGNFIEIDGLGGPCDNRFYITNVRHILDETKGFRSQLTGKASVLP